MADYPAPPSTLHFASPALVDPFAASAQLDAVHAGTSRMALRRRASEKRYREEDASSGGEDGEEYVPDDAAPAGGGAGGGGEEDEERPVKKQKSEDKAGVGIGGSFVYNLHKLLLDPALQDYASFSDDGESFTVHDPTSFAAHALPLYYRHKNFSSFYRQLNMYGFLKLNKVRRGGRKTDDSWSFSHEHFHRGDLPSLALIRRKQTASEPKTVRINNKSSAEPGQSPTKIRVKLPTDDAYDSLDAAGEGDDSVSVDSYLDIEPLPLPAASTSTAATSASPPPQQHQPSAQSLEAGQSPVTPSAAPRLSQLETGRLPTPPPPLPNSTPFVSPTSYRSYTVPPAHPPAPAPARDLLAEITAERDALLALSKRMHADLDAYAKHLTEMTMRCGMAVEVARELKRHIEAQSGGRAVVNTVYPVFDERFLNPSAALPTQHRPLVRPPQHIYSPPAFRPAPPPVVPTSYGPATPAHPFPQQLPPLPSPGQTRPHPPQLHGNPFHPHLHLDTHHLERQPNALGSGRAGGTADSARGLYQLPLPAPAGGLRVDPLPRRERYEGLDLDFGLGDGRGGGSSIGDGSDERRAERFDLPPLSAHSSLDAAFPSVPPSAFPTPTSAHPTDDGSHPLYGSSLHAFAGPVPPVPASTAEEPPQPFAFAPPPPPQARRRSAEGVADGLAETGGWTGGDGRELEGGAGPAVGGGGSRGGS
ncbi:hypothetical protein JCM8097_004684 [Rhodosporidiobolus ruineniae]